MAVRPIAKASVAVIPDFGKFESTVKGFAGRAAGMMGSLTAAVTGVGLAGIVSFGIKSAASLEQAQVGFTTLLGSGKKAQDFLSGLQKFAAATPFELPGLIESSRTLLGVGVDAKKVVPLLTAFGDAAGAVGVGQEGFQRIILATSQAFSAGKFQVGDLNQIMTNGIPIYKLLSEALHKPVPEIRQMASQGKLLAKDVLPVLQKQMEKDYGGAMAKQSQTLAGVWSTLKDSVAIGLANAIKPLVPMMEDFLPKAANVASKALVGISSAIVAVIGGFKSGQANSSGFTGAMQKVGVFIRDAVPVVRNLAIQIGGALVGAFRVVGPAVAAVVGWLDHHRAVAVALIGTLGTLVAIYKVTSIVLNIQKAGLVAYLGLTKAVKVATTLWTGIQWLLNAALNANPIAIVVIALAALAAGLYYAWTHSAKFRDIVIGAWNGIRGVVGAVAGWFTGTLWPGIQAVWHGIASGALWLWHNVIEPVWHGIGAVVNFVVKVVVGYVHLLQAEWRALAAVASWLYNTIIAPVFHAIGRVIQVVMAIVQLELKLVQVFIIGPLASAFRWIYDRVVRPVFTFIANEVRRAIGVAMSVLRAIRDFLLGALTAAFVAIRNKVTAVWGVVTGVFHTAWSAIHGVLSALAGWLTKNLSAALTVLSAAVSFYWGAIKSKISAIWGGIKPIFQALASFVTKTIPNAFSTAVGLVGKAWTKIQDIVKAPITFTVRHVINPLINGFDRVAKAFGTSTIPPIAGFAEGGQIGGPPSSSDNRWAWLRGKNGQVLGTAGLATGEFVVNARDTAKALPLLRWINEGMRGGAEGVRRYLGRPVADMPGDGSEGWAFKGGGLVGFLKDVWGAASNPAKFVKKPIEDALAEIPGSGLVKSVLIGMGRKLISGLTGFLTGGTSGAVSGTMVGAQAFLRAQNGKPYVWASAGPGGYDCSGIVSAVYNLLKGKPLHQHTFSTESAQNFFPKPGPGGPLLAAWSHPGQAPASASVGHMMGMVGGLTFESTGSRGVHLGSTTRHLSDFANIGHFDRGGVVKLAHIARADFGSTVLERGNNLIFNGTGQREPLVSPGGDPGRLHPDDIAALAAAIGGAMGRTLMGTVPAARAAARQGGRNR